jgi:hypothetical protein
MVSALFRINGQLGPTQVSPSSTVTLSLDSNNGVKKVRWQITGTSSESIANPVITPTGYPIGITATFTMPAGSSTIGITCIVNDGRDSSGRIDNNLRSKTAAFVPFANGSRAAFVNETLEFSSTHGWTEIVNQAIKTGASPLDEVLTSGNDADGQDIVGVDVLAANSVAIGGLPSLTGAIKLTNPAFAGTPGNITCRDSLDVSDNNLIGMNASDQVQIGYGTTSLIIDDGYVIAPGDFTCEGDFFSNGDAQYDGYALYNGAATFQGPVTFGGPVVLPENHPLALYVPLYGSTSPSTIGGQIVASGTALDNSSYGGSNSIVTFTSYTTAASIDATAGWATSPVVGVQIADWYVYPHAGSTTRRGFFGLTQTGDITLGSTTLSASLTSYSVQAAGFGLNQADDEIWFGQFDASGSVNSFSTGQEWESADCWQMRLVMSPIALGAYNITFYLYAWTNANRTRTLAFTDTLLNHDAIVWGYVGQIRSQEAVTKRYLQGKVTLYGSDG